MKQSDVKRRRTDVKATKHVGNGIHAEVSKVSAGYADIDRHDSKEAEEFLDVKAAAIEGGAEEDAEGYDHTDADAWEGAAYSADSEIAEGVTDVEYYVGEGTIRNGKWDEMQGVDADDAKVVLDVDDVPIAKDERAAKVSDDTEKFKKVVRR